MNLFVWASFFLSEMLIIFVCYHFIYKKKNLSNWSFLHFLKLLIGYYVFIIRYRLRLIQRNCTMDDFLQKNGSLRYMLFRYVFFGSFLSVFLPGAVVFLMNFLHFPFAAFIIYLAGLSVLIDRLRNLRVSLMYILNESHKFLFKFQREKKQLRRKKEENEVEKDRTVRNQSIEKSKILMAAPMAVCGSIVSILMIREIIKIGRTKTFNLKDSVFSSPFFITVYLVFLIWLIVCYLMQNKIKDTIKQRISYRRSIKHKSDIEVWTTEENREELSIWADEIVRMCSLLNVKEIKIGIDNLDTKKMYSFAAGTQAPIIVIGREAFDRSQKLYREEHFEIIKMLIAHELVHIYYKDTKWMKKVGIIALLYIGSVIYALLVIAPKYNPVFGAAAVAALLILDKAVFAVLRDERYWNQVMEFRADRIGLAISNTWPEILEKALKCTAGNEEDDEKKEKENMIHSIYKREIEQHIHPRIERRIYEVKREVPWSLREYFRYLWIIGRNVLMRKGWRI